MDYLRSYNLLDQSRFYFPSLASVREGGLADQRPSSVTADVLGAPPMPSAAALTPLIMLHGARGLTRGEREIPLDLSLKTIRQTPDSTADAEVLNQQLVVARTHALQMAEALSAKKFPFTPLEMSSGGSANPNSRMRDRFMSPQTMYATGHHLAPPPPPLIRPLATATPTSGSLSLSSSTASVASGFGRGGPASSSENGTGSAFVAPHSSAIHAAVCGGLNGFCLDPRRCRLAAATTASGGSSAGMNESYHAAASAFRAYAAALYEQCHKGSTTSSTTSTTTSSNLSQSGATGVLQGLAEGHLSSATTLPTSSTSSNSSSSGGSKLMTSSLSSSSAPSPSTTVKNPYPVTYDSIFPGLLPPFSPYHFRPPHSNSETHHQQQQQHHHHNHNHSSRLSKDPNCACCNVTMTKPYPLSCLCCFPAMTPNVAAAGRAVSYEALFGCCPPTSNGPVVIQNVSTFGGHSQSSSSDTKTKSSKHHHHHHHHHRHEKSATDASSSSLSPLTTTKHENKRSVNTPVNGDVTPKEGSKSRLPSSPSPSVSIKQPSPPEGGRWIPHLHSNQSEKMNSTSRRCTPTATDSNVKGVTNKVFAPLVRIPPSPPEGVFQGPSKAPSPLVNSGSTPSLTPSPALNRPTAFTAVYSSRNASMSADVVTPTARRQTSSLDTPLQVNKQEVSDGGRDLSCSPPKMAKLTVEKDQESSSSVSSKCQWMSPSSGPSSPTLATKDGTDGKCKTDKPLLNRVWEANYASDSVRQVPVVLAVTPMDVKNTVQNETLNAPQTQSPVEASPATTSVVSAKSEPVNNNNDDDCSAKSVLRTEASSPPSVGIRSENVVSPLVLKAATTVDHEKRSWKRVAPTESLISSNPSKKLKKKDVIVISMKDEHQISTNLVMKSVKRKLEEPKSQLNGVNSPIGDGQRSPPIVNYCKLSDIKQLSLGTTEIQPSTVVHTASLVTTTTTTTTARFTSCQPEVVTQQGNPQTSDDKNSILKLSVKVAPPRFNGGNSGSNSNSSVKSSTADEKLPVLGITITKTSGETVYKSSVLQTSSNGSGNVTKTAEFTPVVTSSVAMLRRYYEDQKLRLQQAEEFNRLRFTKGNNPLTNAPLKDTLASSTSSSVRPSPPVTVSASITASALDVKPKVTAAMVMTSSAVVTENAVKLSPNSCVALAANLLPKNKQPETTVDEAADDGDDEREDDDEEDVTEDEEDEDDDDDYEDDDDDDEDYESDDGARKVTKDGGRKKLSSNELRNHVQSKSSNQSGIETSNKTGNASHKNDSNSKRVMYNKALGETMLHRAARLGQMDHLKYYLETQSSTINARDNAGYTPLHECCSRGHIDAARMLLQYGADVNSAAAGGVRPIHDAVENDYLEVVRLLLSYGADPLIATYSGLTPPKLTRSPAMMEFFKGFLADVTGECVTPILPWQFRGSARCLDTKPSGYDPLEDMPSEDERFVHNQNNSGDDCDVDDDAALIFEVSDKPHIPTYHVPAQRRNGSGILSFCLLHDVLNQTGMNRGAFLACYPDIQVEKMARQEFVNQVKCTQIMVDTSAALKTNCPPSVQWVELVRWDSNLRDILDIERISIPIASCKPESSS